MALSHNQVTDIRPLAGLKNLRSLWLEGNGIRDFGALRRMTQLRELRIWNEDRQYAPKNGLQSNRFTDLTPVRSLIGLEVLYAASCEVSDISPLFGLVKLRKLSLSSNKIVDISPLAGLHELQFLYLD